MSTSFVFVYGTLQRDERNHHYLVSSTYLGEATLKDYALYDLPQGYPGILPFIGYQVQGEVYEVNEPTLTNLDYLEGEGSLYKRTLVQVTLNDNKTVNVFTYVYLRHVQSHWRDTRVVARWSGKRV